MSEDNLALRGILTDHALVYRDGNPYCKCDLDEPNGASDTGEDVLTHVLDLVKKAVGFDV